MSWTPYLDPQCPDVGDVDAIETVIVPRARDIGGFEVRRALPSARRQMVGPFIFFDQMGPAEFITGAGIDVRPHPHIGLATVSYLYEGSMHHRDSLGTSMEIRPGAVNWMIAGKGISHSERSSNAARENPGNKLFGIQTWVALPEQDEEVDPGFEHQPKTALPVIEDGGNKMRLILGSAYGQTAPVKTFSEMFYLDAVLEPGARFPLPKEHEDRAIYVVSGDIEVAGQSFTTGQMMVFRPGDEITVKAVLASRIMLLGGETLNGPRYIWWNFVASSQDKIEAAKQAWKQGDWANGQFSLPPDDHHEYIPLPEK